jgi:hypothetical protein
MLLSRLILFDLTFSVVPGQEQGFLLVEIRIAIQGIDLHCFPVHVCYLLN